MLKVLKKFCENKSAVSIYTNINENNSFAFGYIIAVNESQIVIHNITPDGTDDGIKFMYVDKIFRVDEKGQYHEKMELLCQGNTLSTYNLDIVEDDIKKAVVLYAFQNKLILSITLLDSGYIDMVGYIESIDGENLKIFLVDEYGCADGFSYISMDNISQIIALSEDEKRIDRLYKLRQK